MRRTRTEHLQALIASLQREEHGRLYIEFKPFTGWILTGDEPRHFGDQGDVIGANWQEAEQEIRWLLA